MYTDEIMEEAIVFLSQINAIESKLEKLLQVPSKDAKKTVASMLEARGLARYAVERGKRVYAVSLRKGSKPKQVDDKDACVALVREMGMEVPQKWTNGTSATVTVKA